MAIEHFDHYGRAHVKPGVFCYHGCGVGVLHLWRGQTVSTCASEARKICEAVGLTFRHEDSMQWPSDESITAKAGKKTHAFCKTYYGRHTCAA